MQKENKNEETNSDTYLINHRLTLKYQITTPITKSSSDCIDNFEYVKSLKCNKTIISYDIISLFLSNIKKSLYIHNNRSCRKFIHLASFTIE